MAALHITDIESAINWWRDRKPSPDGITACAEVLALAEVYALMVYYHEMECDEASMPPAAHAAWLGWYATTPDAPCIAICSTSQGDAVCKGCGRTFSEVQHWTGMTPGEKRATWRRITREGTAWRFNRYAERAGADDPLPTTAAGSLDDLRAPHSGVRPRGRPGGLMTRAGGLWHNARRIAPLAWPVFIGQVAVLAFSTVDTVMVARASALDLAALAIGAAVYVSIFVGFMGVVMAVGPIAGQAFGGGRIRESGRQAEQAVWLALALAVPGCALLLFPDPFLALANAEPAVAAKVRDYLRGLAFALPPALVFAAYRGFNIAVSRPKAVMALQLGALALKVPLNAALVFGLTLPLPGGEWRTPAFGAAGCGVATAIVMWCQLGAAMLLLRRDPFYRPFGLGRGIGRPERASQAALLRLGVPMGLSIMVEVTGFTFMAFFVSRLGATAVAGHQIAVNMVSMMFMLPLAIANASSTLVAQRIGAGDGDDARRLGWSGLGMGVLIAGVLGGTVYLLRAEFVGLYTGNQVIVAAAVPLLAWVALFHVADAAQTVAAFVLRAYRIATVPVVVYVVALWGVGLGGGYVAAFDLAGLDSPSWMRGAQGFWSMATFGLATAAVAMTGYLAWTLRRPRGASGTLAPLTPA